MRLASQLARFDLLSQDFQGGLQSDSEIMFKDSAGVAILEKLAAALKRAGIKCSTPKFGKGCDAAFQCKLTGFSAVIILNVLERNSNGVHCELRTWPARKLVSHMLGREFDNESLLRWERFCSTLNVSLREVLSMPILKWEQYGV
jgi:hypothetical protein